MLNTIGFLGCGNMGGAIARAVCKAADPQNVWLANRTAAKAHELAAEFAGSSHAGLIGCALAELAGLQFDVVINATSASLSDAAPDLPAGLYAPGSLAYDMM